MDETGYASAGDERRMNAEGGDESRIPGASAARMLADPTVASEDALDHGCAVRTNGGALTDGSRPADSDVGAGRWAGAWAGA